MPDTLSRPMLRLIRIREVADAVHRCAQTGEPQPVVLPDGRQITIVRVGEDDDAR